MCLAASCSKGYETDYTIALMDLITDSDAIMKDTQAIPSCITTIKHLLISRVIKKNGNF